MIEIDMLACSINSFYRTFRGRMLISKNGREFKKDIEEFINKYDKTLGKIKLVLTFHFKDKRKRDVDNYAKVLIDCLKNKLFEDDDQIFQLEMEKHIGMESNKIFIDVISLEDVAINNNTT